LAFLLNFVGEDFSCEYGDTDSRSDTSVFCFDIRTSVMFTFEGTDLVFSIESGGLAPLVFFFFYDCLRPELGAGCYCFCS